VVESSPPASSREDMKLDFRHIEPERGVVFVGETYCIHINIYVWWSLVFGRVCFPPSVVFPPPSLVFGGCAFPPVSLGPAGDCPCRD